MRILVGREGHGNQGGRGHGGVSKTVSNSKNKCDGVSGKATVMNWDMKKIEQRKRLSESG